MAKSGDKLRLSILEALLILEHGPMINKQWESFPQILKLFSPKHEITKKWQVKTAVTSSTRHVPESSSAENSVSLSVEGGNNHQVLSQRTLKLLSSPINLNRAAGNFNENASDNNISINVNALDVNSSQTNNLLIDGELSYSESESQITPSIFGHSTEEIPDMLGVLTRFGFNIDNTDEGEHHPQSDVADFDVDKDTLELSSTVLASSEQPVHEPNHRALLEQIPSVPFTDSTKNTQLTPHYSTQNVALDIETDFSPSPEPSIGARIKQLRRCFPTHPNGSTDE